MNNKFKFLILIVLFLGTSCTEKKDVHKIRYAKKQYYLGHDYFLKYINAINSINKLRIKNNNLNNKLKKLSLSKGETPSLILIKEAKRKISKNLNNIKNKTVLAERFLNAAMVELGKALRTNPDHWRANFELGLIYLKKGTTEIDMAKRFTCMKGDSLQEHMNRAFVLLNKAKKFFLKSSNDKELESESFNNASAIEIYMHNYQKAVRYAQKALDNLAYEGAFAARANLGWAYYFLKKYEDAEAQLKQVIMLKPKYCIARYRLARVYFKQKQYKKAAKEFEKTISQGPPCNSIQEAYQYLGLSYLKLNQLEKGQYIFERCILVAPSSCVGLQCKSNLNILNSDSSTSN